MESPDDVLLDSLKNFYSNPKNAAQLKDVLHNPDNTISLRSLDWLITNYSKKKNISYMLPGDVRVFNIFTDYKSQLKSSRNVCLIVSSVATEFVLTYRMERPLKLQLHNSISFDGRSDMVSYNIAKII